jgi:predicted lipid-binding transport protein (Tim44 family)
MLKHSQSALCHVVTSFKVVALVTVLGTVVMAAERHLATRISPEEIIATDMAPATMASSAAAPGSAPAQQPSADYFPSHFDETKGETAEQAPTF